MDLGILLHALTPSLDSVAILVTFFTYLAIFGSILPGKVVQGVVLRNGTRLHYQCNGLLSLLLLVGLLGVRARMNFISPAVISHRGLELLSTTFIFSVLVTLVLYVAGSRSHNQGSSLKAHITRNLIHDWFFFVRAGMMGWLLINLSILAKSVLDGLLSRSMILYQTFSALYILNYFAYEEYMTSTWDIIAERLGFMVGGFCVTSWWLLRNKVELTTAAVIANCIVFLIGYLVFRGANKQKHMFKMNPKALIWGKPPKVIGGKLLASGYCSSTAFYHLNESVNFSICDWHCYYLGDLLLALSFSLPCGISSPIPYFYPIYLLILLIWRERRDEARCAEKYRELWAEYCRLVPWRILPYFY
ncbi:hypothetical protein LWI29_036049 [Acer saccharum]|uniref:Delta(14)-sterol reductase n=1 Tax=Acer saccharum TaxID=4024 RepID=A0AA39S644_ACESA|nr:hypothetical protein LWI29_036049 [Acer saccharum]